MQLIGVIYELSLFLYILNKMYGFVLVCIRIVLMKEQYIYKCQSKIFILHICAKIENLLNRCAANDKM